MNAAALEFSDPSAGHDLSWLPPGPHTLDVFDILPDDHRYELVDGMLIIVDAPLIRHQDVSGNLFLQMHSLLSGTAWKPMAAAGFSRNAFNYRIPDLTVCKREAPHQGRRKYLNPSECLLLCEIVSDSTVLTDRVTKPAEYASTGVPNYLRVEFNDSGRVELFLSENIPNPHREVESDPERVYRQIGQTTTGGGLLPLPKPFTGPLDPNAL